MARAVTRVPAEDKKAIGKAFPLISRIKDLSIRDGVIKAWHIAWKESAFEKLDDAPFSFDPIPGDTLVRHTNAGANGAYAMGKHLQQEYGAKINLDYIIAGALLQNFDKMVMFEMKGNEVVHSPLGKKIVHGAYGGHIAMLAGLPQDIVFIVMAHSPSVHVERRSPEAQLILYAETANLQALRAAYGVWTPRSSH